MANHRNVLYYGHNLDNLRKKVDPESVDLCYINPPFNGAGEYILDERPALGGR